MKTLLLVLLAAVGLAITPIAMKNLERLMPSPVSKVQINPAVQPTAPLPQTSLLDMPEAPKVVPVQKTLILEEADIVTLKGPVTTESVSAAQRALQEKSRKLPKTASILLVLDTPGGSVDAGLELIDFAKALPQKVHTITLFAASMGFQIAQNLETRYITRSGLSMSHRARLEGLGGQVKGELEERYKMIRRDVDYLDAVAAKRLGIELKAYEAKIFNEYWVHGYDAVAEKVADEEVLLRCGESLKGSYPITFETFLGPIVVTFSKCPLIKAPESISFGGMSESVDSKTVRDAMVMSLTNQTKFVEDFILTNKFYDIFK